MRFFSKIVFLCNCCFLITVIMRLVELRQKTTAVKSDSLLYQPLQSTLIILGYGAILINAVFFLLGIYSIVFKKLDITPRWLVYFNLMLFPVEIFYFFF
jgi:hypothetical protein